MQSCRVVIIDAAGAAAGVAFVVKCGDIGQLDNAL